MWLRVILTAFALAVVLYLQFGFNIKDWIKESANQPNEPAENIENIENNPEAEPVSQP
ncbi:hypothetical protein [Oligoflexus tunisiensis]|uniref:hypothetical protein n=1 Tax=Oligoflexus tunisiensis TaxID=708132 RepID=UPI00159EF702|nr:hypothetical protein [Oligoflexus tunisiensis]